MTHTNQACRKMWKWKIEFWNMGRERAAGTATVEAPNLVKAKQEAMCQCRRHLPDGGEIYLEAQGHYTYAVILAMEEAGEVRITRLAACSDETC